LADQSEADGQGDATFHQRSNVVYLLREAVPPHPPPSTCESEGPLIKGYTEVEAQNESGDIKDNGRWNMKLFKRCKAWWTQRHTTPSHLDGGSWKC